MKSLTKNSEAADPTKIQCSFMLYKWFLQDPTVEEGIAAQRWVKKRYINAESAFMYRNPFSRAWYINAESAFMCGLGIWCAKALPCCLKFLNQYLSAFKFYAACAKKSLYAMYSLEDSEHSYTCMSIIF